MNSKINNNSFATIEYNKDEYNFLFKDIKKIDVLESTLIITNERGNEPKKISLLSIINLSVEYFLDAK
uniref:hypothetical protein n=1 Tax=Staphylococcus gallinarum TaxID=1293 RepID=UPI0039F6738F